jgi:hypothetical protein
MQLCAFALPLVVSLPPHGWDCVMCKNNSMLAGNWAINNPNFNNTCVRVRAYMPLTREPLTPPLFAPPPDAVLASQRPLVGRDDRCFVRGGGAELGPF